MYWTKRSYQQFYFILQLIPSHLDVINEVPLPPGLKSYLGGAYGWLLSSVTEPAKPPQDEKEENNPPGTETDLDASKYFKKEIFDSDLNICDKIIVHLCARYQENTY